MRIPPPPHRWTVTPARAIAIQRKFASRVRVCPLADPVTLVAGMDVAFSKDGADCIAGVVVWDVTGRVVVEQQVARRRVTFPYVPGLLTFREAPAVLAALRKLRCTPDAFMLDGQGFAHPRRFGLACHVGVILDRPTLGCGKSRLCGVHDEPAPAKGSTAPLRDEGEVIGHVLRTRDGVRCVYVSVGHRITLDDAVALVLRCCGGFRLPEPTRLAHQLVTRTKADESA
jgi:deoxyribonuclease V